MSEKEINAFLSGFLTGGITTATIILILSGIIFALAEFIG